MDWVKASGRGQVFSFVKMHQIYHPWFAEDGPYVIVDIRLEEGPHMISRVHADQSRAISIGADVIVDYDRIDDDLVLPIFRIAS